MIRISPKPLVLLALVGISGCAASLDPKPDVERASSLVEGRTGLPTGWLDATAEGTWDGVSQLTERAALVRALQNNRELQAEIEEVAAARADLVQSGLLPNPVVSAALRFPVSGGGAVIDAAVVQEFTALWLRPSRMTGAKAELDRTILSLSDRALRLVANVKQAHARALSGQRTLGLLKDSEELLQRAITLSEKRVAAGEGTRLDVNRLQQLLLGVQAESRRAETELGKRKRELLAAMGEAGRSADWEVAESASREMTALPTEPELFALVSTQKLDVAAASFAVRSRVAELRATGLERLPGVSGGASYERQDGEEEIGPELEVGIPIFDTGAARVAKSKALLGAERKRAEQLTQEALLQARSAYLDLQQAETLTRFYREQVVRLAEENLRLTEASLRAGEVDQTVLLEAQRELLSARRTLEELVLDREVSRAELEYAVGGNLDGEHLERKLKGGEAALGEVSHRN